MRRMIAVTMAAAVLVGLAFSVSSSQAEEKEKKVTIKKVMANHKGGAKSLLGKVTGGKATQKEKNQLLTAYIALTENKPPKGDAESWKKLTGGVIVAAAKVVAGQKDAEAELKKATNCGACHGKHK